MKTLFVVLLVGLLLVGVGSALVGYSNPTHKDGSEIIYTPKIVPLKEDCDRQEWNSNFAQFREGFISKEDMKSYIGGCKW